MSTTSNSVANQALQMIGDNIPAVVGNAPGFDSSTAGQALAQLYSPVVNTIARQFGWDFARTNVALSLSGNPAPVGWGFEYLYPGNGVEVWQLMPAVIADPNNPLPQNWTVGNIVVSGTQTKVIWSNLQGALAIYNNAPQESTWDAEFQEAVVRLLASELSMALFGRPDSAQEYLNSGAAFEQIGESRLG
jgi:hypothetical protein